MLVWRKGILTVLYLPTGSKAWEREMSTACSTVTLIQVKPRRLVHFWMSLSLSVCLSVCLCTSMSVCVCLYLSVCLSVCVYSEWASDCQVPSVQSCQSYGRRPVQPSARRTKELWQADGEPSGQGIKHVISVLCIITRLLSQLLLSSTFWVWGLSTRRN